MFKRFFLSSVLLGSLLAAAPGCDEAHDASTLQVDEAALEVCPAVYEPVCGKDGMTYSNTCYAGGRKNVAYEGECVDACIAATCPTGTECSTNSKGEAVCSPIVEDPCAVVRCAAGTECRVLGNGTAVCR